MRCCCITSKSNFDTLHFEHLVIMINEGQLWPCYSAGRVIIIILLRLMIIERVRCARAHCFMICIITRYHYHLTPVAPPPGVGDLDQLRPGHSGRLVDRVVSWADANLNMGH